MRKIFFFNLIIIIISFLSLEFILRYFNVINLQGYDENLYYSKNKTNFHSPNILKTVMGKKIRTDNNGFRIPLKNFSYNKNLKNILILGDSVGFGVGVEEKKTFVGILRKKIEKNLYNTSVAGYRIESYSYLLPKYHNQFTNVKEYLIFLCLNDIISEDGIIQEEKLKIESNDKNFYNSFLNKLFFIKINFYLREKSAVFNLTKAIGTQNIKRHYDYIKPYYDNQIMLEYYEKNLDKIIKYSQSNKLNVKFILLPYKHQIKKNCSKDIMNPQKQINSIFKKLNYQLFDFSQDFCNKMDNSKLFLNFDPMHLSNNGHKFVSQLLLKKGIMK